MRLPEQLVMAGGVLILFSGVVSLIVALTFGAVLYEVDPNGLFGHVGIVAGIVAIAIGAFLFWFGRLEYTKPGQLFLAGIVSIVIGHFGAIAGALFIGTAGLLCCYVAGVWFLVLAVLKYIGKIKRIN